MKGKRAKPTKFSSRLHGSSIFRLPRAPKIEPRAAKLHEECGFDGPSGVQVALGGHLGGQMASKRTPRGQGAPRKRVCRAQLGVQEARAGGTNGCTELNLASKRPAEQFGVQVDLKEPGRSESTGACFVYVYVTV